MSAPTYVRIVGIVDALGYLRCEHCVNVVDYDRGYVWSDTEPHAGEACDMCGLPCNAPRDKAPQ